MVKTNNFFQKLKLELGANVYIYNFLQVQITTKTSTIIGKTRIEPYYTPRTLVKSIPHIWMTIPILNLSPKRPKLQPPKRNRLLRTVILSSHQPGKIYNLGLFVTLKQPDLFKIFELFFLILQQAFLNICLCFGFTGPKFKTARQRVRKNNSNILRRYGNFKRSEF